MFNVQHPLLNVRQTVQLHNLSAHQRALDFAVFNFKLSMFNCQMFVQFLNVHRTVHLHNLCAHQRARTPPLLQFTASPRLSQLQTGFVNCFRPFHLTALSSFGLKVSLLVATLTIQHAVGGKHKFEDQNENRILYREVGCAVAYNFSKLDTDGLLCG